MGKLAQYWSQLLAFLGLAETALDDVNRQLDKAAEAKGKVDEITRKAKEIGGKQ